MQQKMIIIQSNRIPSMGAKAINNSITSSGSVERYVYILELKTHTISGQMES